MLLPSSHFTDFHPVLPCSPLNMIYSNYVALAIGLFLAFMLVLGLCACSMRRRERERALLDQTQPVLLLVSVDAKVS